MQMITIRAVYSEMKSPVAAALCEAIPFHRSPAVARQPLPRSCAPALPRSRDPELPRSTLGETLY
eukprot:4209817-Heterocapsa_arctica.AAC.1